MKKMKKIMIVTLAVAMAVFSAGCEYTPSASVVDANKQMGVADNLAYAQPTPTDISYSLERYNLIRRAYWVNGQREKANSLVCPVEKPLGYIVLLSGSTIVNTFVVDGKVTSLNSFLTPNCVEDLQAMRGSYYLVNVEMADVDGSYGENDRGIFFFTPDGNYFEWTAEYLYSDVPFVIEAPAVRFEEVNDEK